MKYVIWGAGRRGERVLQVVGNANIIAYIESDKSKIGEKYCGKEVISFEKYLNSYTDFFLIISTREYREIVQLLKNKGLSQYFIFSDCPSELVWDKGDFSMEKIPLYKCKKEERIAIYGTNLFSVMLYDFMKQHGYEQLFFINNKEYDCQKNLKQMGYKFASMSDNKDSFDRVLVTNNEFEQAISQYKNCRIEDFYDFSYQLSEYRNSSLARFKNIHNGQRCFIVATGPSLKLDDLECLRKNKEITMSVNMVYRAFPLVTWRPDYYVMQDAYGLQYYETDIAKLDLPNIFIADIWPKFWKNKLNDNFHKYHLHAIFDKHGIPLFSSDITKRICQGGTVIYLCLQIAIYMGFTEIYLIGVDSNYNGNIQKPENHFIKNYLNQDDKQPGKFPLNESFLAFQAAHRYAERQGIKIYNATRGGKLEVFERVEFDSLFR